jgi:hypothetical protein
MRHMKEKEVVGISSPYAMSVSSSVPSVCK